MGRYIGGGSKGVNSMPGNLSTNATVGVDYPLLGKFFFGGSVSLARVTHLPVPCGHLSLFFRAVLIFSILTRKEMVSYAAATQNRRTCFCQ